MVGMAAILAVPVLVVLLIAVALWMNQLGVSLVASYFLSALLGAVVSAIIGLIGASRLSAVTLRPDETLHQLRRDVAAVRNSYNEKLS